MSTNTRPTRAEIAEGLGALFVIALLTATIDVIRFRHRGTWRRAAGRTSMAALVTAIIVLTSIRGSTAAHRVGPMPAVTAVVDASPAPAAILSASQPAVLTYIVAPGESLWDIAVTHYGNGEQWHTIYDANVGVDQPGGAALSDPSLIDPGWTLTIPEAASSAPAAAVPSTQAPAPPSPAPLPPTTEIPTSPVAASPASVPLPAPHSAPHSVSQLAPEH